MFASSWNTFFYALTLLSFANCCPILHYGKASLLGTSSHMHYYQMDKKFQIYDLFEILIFNLHLSTLMTIATSCHRLMGYIISCFWCKPMDRYLTPHRNIKHMDYMLVHKAKLNIAYHTTKSLDPRGTSCILCLLIELLSFLISSLWWYSLSTLKVNMNVHSILFFKTYLL